MGIRKTKIITAEVGIVKKMANEMMLVVAQWSEDQGLSIPQMVSATAMVLARQVCYLSVGGGKFHADLAKENITRIEEAIEKEVFNNLAKIDFTNFRNGRTTEDSTEA